MAVESNSIIAAESAAARYLADLVSQREAEFWLRSGWDGALTRAERAVAQIYWEPPKPDPVADLPRPEKQPFQRTVSVLDEEYRELAAKLGIESTAILEARLEQVLADEMLPTYDLAKVAAYLDNECRKVSDGRTAGSWFTGVVWRWSPVRKQDRMKTGAGRIGSDVYQKEIPYAVLCTMNRVAKCLPEACFFISEIREVKDPFLGVTVPGSEKMWVLERWDEPGFRS